MNDAVDSYEAWRIDTLDSRGGLGFTSFRPSDLVLNDTQEPTMLVDVPAISIGPPDFRPESVSSRAVGLAAGRGAFQIGLFIDGEEVAFASLVDVVEFVRRCYLTGTGGDGPDGGGGPVPTSPEGAPPDFPAEPDTPTEYPEGAYRFLSALIAEITEFAHRSTRIGYSSGLSVKTDPWSWAKGQGNIFQATGGTLDGCDALLRAAVTLILEMVRRYPLSGVNEDLLRWHGTAQSLGRALWRLGLWPFLLSPGRPALLSRVRTIFEHLQTAEELERQQAY